MAEAVGAEVAGATVTEAVGAEGMVLRTAGTDDRAITRPTEKAPFVYRFMGVALQLYFKEAFVPARFDVFCSEKVILPRRVVVEVEGSAWERRRTRRV